MPSLLLSAKFYLEQARSQIPSRLHHQYRCTDCGAPKGHRSRPRNPVEKYFYPLFLRQPVRCDNCWRRSWVSLFTQLVAQSNKRFPDHTERPEATGVPKAATWLLAGFSSKPRKL